MKAKQLGPWVLWFAVSLGLAGCPGDTPGPYRGKRDVLFFFPRGERPWHPVADGLEEDVLIPASLSNSEGQGHITYDFEGTTLEAEADAGLTVVRTWQSTRSHHFTYRCEPSEQAERHVEVRVRVRGPDGSVRYADAIDVPCARPTELMTQLEDIRPRSETSYLEPVRAAVVGTRLVLSLDLGVRRDGTYTALTGRGPLEWVGTPGVLRQVEESPVVASWANFLVETQAPGVARVRLGVLEAPLDLEVVADEAVRLQLDSSHIVGGKGWSVLARAFKASGWQQVRGVEEAGCSFEVRPASGEPFVQEVREGPCRIQVPESAGPGTVCVSIPGRPWSACEDYRP